MGARGRKDKGKRWSRVCAVGLLSSVACLPVAARADGVVVAASLGENAIWDSNPMMRVQDDEALYGSTTMAKLALSQKTLRNDWRLQARVEQNLFNDADYNSTDFFGLMDWTRRTQRAELNFAGQIDHDTTRSSETTDFGEQTVNAKHNSYRFAPTLAYALSSRNTVSVAGGYTKSTYDGGSYTDYHTISVTPSFQRALTQNYTGVVSFLARRYQADVDHGLTVDTYGPSVGVKGQIAKDWSWRLQGGREATRQKTDQLLVQDWTWNAVYAAGAKYEGERDLVDFSAVRAQESYGNGDDYLLSSFTLQLRRNISKTFSVNGQLGYKFSDDKDTSVNHMDDMASAQVGLAYHLTRDFDITTSYRRREETYTLREGTAKQDVFRLGVVVNDQGNGFW